MVQPEILEKLDKLPEPLQIEVLHYIEFLLAKYANRPTLEQPEQLKKRKAGLLKGKIWMSDDFDSPLEDLKDYM